MIGNNHSEYFSLCYISLSCLIPIVISFSKPYEVTNWLMPNLLCKGEAEVEEKELEHSSLQEKLDMELKELDQKLEQKEVILLILMRFYSYFLAIQ